MDNVCQGFDQTVLRQIKDCINLPQQTKEPVQQELSPEGTLLRFGEDMPSGNGQKKTPLENWQKYMENGEYLRSSEIDEEQNYNMIDGRRNNMPPQREGWQGIRPYKIAPQTGGNCKTEREIRAADGNGRGYGAQAEVRKGEVSGRCCRMLLPFYVLNNREFLCIIKP